MGVIYLFYNVKYNLCAIINNNLVIVKYLS